MAYHLIPLIAGIITITAALFLSQKEITEKLLKFGGIVLLLYKAYFFISTKNLPVEISAVSYFLVGIIIVFKLKKAYHIASFFGILAGFGFYIEYSVGGSMANGSLQDVIIATAAHNYLLFSGIVLNKKYDFSGSNRTTNWVIIFAMLAWAALYFNYMPENPCFILYLIRPDKLFLFRTENTVVNLIISLIAYSILTALLKLYANIFYRINIKSVEKRQNADKKVEKAVNTKNFSLRKCCR